MVVASRWAVLTVSDGGIRLILELHRLQTRKTPPTLSRSWAACQGLRLRAGGAMRDAGYTHLRAPFPTLVNGDKRMDRGCSCSLTALTLGAVSTGRHKGSADA